MNSEVEKLIKKSLYYEKRNSIQRRKARTAFSKKLKEWRIEHCEVLSHIASSETRKILSENEVWKSNYRNTCNKVFEVDYCPLKTVFANLKKSIIALKQPAFFMYGSEWESHGALAISNKELIEHLPRVSFLLSHSFILSNETGAKCLRFEADEIGGKFTTAEVYLRE